MDGILQSPEVFRTLLVFLFSFLAMPLLMMQSEPLSKCIYGNNMDVLVGPWLCANSFSADATTVKAGWQRVGIW